MTQTLPDADIRGYYHALGIELPGWSRTEASVRCFANRGAHRRGDRDPSCSVNLEHGAWHCHACGARGGAFDAAIALGYANRAAIDLMIRNGLVEPGGEHGFARRASLRRAKASGGARRTRRASRPTLEVNESDVRRWQGALTHQEHLIACLARTRGWRSRAVGELGLGFDCGRLTIPVRDHDLHLIGLLRYQPWPKPGQPKMLAATGSRRALVPHPATENSQSLLIVEGEPDMIAARSRDLPAIALPGVDAWRNEWKPLFADRHVSIIMDADAEGRRTAERIKQDLAGHTDAVIIHLAPDRADGYDLTKWLLERPVTAPEVLHAELLSLRTGTAQSEEIGSQRG